MNSEANQIIDYVDRLKAYAQSKLADKDLAADAVQEAVTRAVKALPQLKDSDKLVPWLYAILRNTIADLLRKQAREISAPDAIDQIAAPEVSEIEKVCDCFKPLIAQLPSDYAQLINTIELEEKPRQQVADSLGISMNNLNVKVHRAREKLRAAIESTCLLCAKHGCLNCTCNK